MSDDLTPLTEFRSTVPAADDATAKRIYALATHTPSQRSRPNRRKIGLATAAAAAVIAGSAIAAVTLLGQPAPKSVQTAIHRSAVILFKSHPGLVKSTARVVAESPDATLYGISDQQGNYCVELIGARKGLVWSFSCDQGLRVGGHFVTPGAEGLDITSITVDGIEPPVVQWGRLASGTTMARAVYPNGTTEEIPIGAHGFFLYEPSQKNQELARQVPMTLQFLRPDGTAALSTQALPPQPLTTRGPRQHQTISGHVLITGAANVAVYGKVLGEDPASLIPIRADGTFTSTTSINPSGSFGVLQVVDKNGHPLSELLDPVPEVFWKQLVAQARQTP
jgi:hypothetical protein